MEAQKRHGCVLQKGSIKSLAVFSPMMTSKSDKSLAESEGSLLEFESAMLLSVVVPHL